MKKFIFSMAIAAMIALMPNASNAQLSALGFEMAGYTPATSKAKVAIGKVTMLNTQNLKLVPGAQIYLLQDLKDANIFYVAISLDDSLFRMVSKKNSKVFYAQALEIDKAQTEIILTDYSDILDANIAGLQKEADELKVKPANENKPDKKARLATLAQKNSELSKAKSNKTSLIEKFKKLIGLQAESTKIYRIVHSEIKAT